MKLHSGEKPKSVNMNPMQCDKLPADQRLSYQIAAKTTGFAKFIIIQLNSNDESQTCGSDFQRIFSYILR